MPDIAPTKPGGLPASPDALVAGLANLAANVQTGGGTPYLRLLKSGAYVYGPENIEIEEGSLWAVNPFSIQHGFACWSDGELLGEQMFPFNAQLPNPDTLPDYGDEWKPQISAHLKCLNGEDEGVEVLYKSTSLGLRTAMKDLINAIIAKAGEDPEHLVPVISLNVGSYHHKKYGEVFYPEFEIVDWIGMDGEGAGAEQAAKSGPDPDETVEQGPGPEPELEKEPAKKADGRTRRSRAAKSADVDDAPAAGEGRERKRRRRRA